MPGAAAVGGDDRIPVTLLTGWLGAGKTTVLNHLIGQARGRRILVVVNEFGEIGIDGALIDAGPEDLIELNSGCLCCVVRGDLIRALRALAARDGDRPEAVVIETTGLAHPAPVLQTFLADQVLAGHFRLDAVVAVVDAIHAPAQLETEQDAADQVALADLIILNKVSDAADQGAAAAAALGRLNPHAPVLRCDRGAVGAEAILGLHAFDPATLSTRLGGLAFDADLRDDDHHHDPAAPAAHCLTAEGPFDPGLLSGWLETLLEAEGDRLLRIKGVLPVAGEGPVVVQGVHRMTETAPAPAGALPPGTPGRLVLIGRGLDAKRLTLGLAACRATH